MRKEIIYFFQGNILKYQRLQIQAYKEDGSFHRAWFDDYLIYEDDDCYILASTFDRIEEDRGRRWVNKDPSIKIMMKKQFYNVIAMFKDGMVNYYCNLASPTIRDDDVLFYIDYDLDVKYTASLDKIAILDEREYAHHKMIYHYSDKLENVLYFTKNKIVQMIREHVFPFVSEQIKALFNTFLEERTK